MSGLVIGTTEITDPQAMQPYLERVPDLVAEFGGTFLHAGPIAAVLEGRQRPTVCAVIVFDSVVAARTWYSSREYEGLRAHRQQAGRSNVILLDAAPGFA